MNRDTVVLNRHPRVFCFLSRRVKFCGVILNVIGLPAERWVAHIHGWLFDRVDATAFIVLTLESE